MRCDARPPEALLGARNPPFPAGVRRRAAREATLEGGAQLPTETCGGKGIPATPQLHRSRGVLSCGADGRKLIERQCVSRPNRHRPSRTPLASRRTLEEEFARGTSALDRPASGGTSPVEVDVPLCHILLQGCTNYCTAGHALTRTLRTKPPRLWSGRSSVPYPTLGRPCRNHGSGPSPSPSVDTGRKSGRTSPGAE